MKSATVAGGAIAAVLVVVVLANTHRPLGPDVASAAAASAITLSTATTEASQGFLYGRVTRDDDATYEGRLRFGGEEEAFWGHYFNGLKRENPWAMHVPGARLTRYNREQ